MTTSKDATSHIGVYRKARSCDATPLQVRRMCPRCRPAWSPYFIAECVLQPIHAKRLGRLSKAHTMHKVLQDPTRVLLSLSTEELQVLTRLVREARDGHLDIQKSAFVSAVLGDMLASLEAEVHASRRSGELVQVWEDGGVMVRVMNTYGDPVEMDADQAREFSERLQSAIQDAL